MDIMKISSKIITGIISKFIEKLIKKETGVDISIKLEQLVIENKEGTTKLHLSIDGELDTEDILKIINF